MLEQLVNIKGCSKDSVSPKSVLSKVSKDLNFIKFFGGRKLHIPKYKSFGVRGRGRGHIF